MVLFHLNMILKSTMFGCSKFKNKIAGAKSLLRYTVDVSSLNLEISPPEESKSLLTEEIIILIFSLNGIEFRPRRQKT